MLTHTDTDTFVVGAGGDSSNMPRGRGPCVQKRKGGAAAEDTKNQVQVNMGAMTIGSVRTGVLLSEEIGLIHIEVEEDMRPYADGERRRPIPRPREWVTTDEARTTIDVRDRLRAIRIGNELAFSSYRRTFLRRYVTHLW